MSSRGTRPHPTARQAVTLSLVLPLLGLVGAAGTTAPATASVSMDPPGAVQAGPVELTGSAGVEPGAPTTVLYVLDATRSSGRVAGMDCSGDGVGGTAADDLNGDGSAGDVLDCEIAAVAALNRDLAGQAGVQAGVVAFAEGAAAADLDPGPAAPAFVPLAGAGAAQVDAVARSVQRGRIGLHDVRDLSVSGPSTAFSNAATTALATLADAPAGPTYIMFLSDGRSGVDDSVLTALGASGVRLRSFAVGASASCSWTGSLQKMAVATGETCRKVDQPATLAADLVGSSPVAVDGVTVSIGDVAVAARLDAVGGWRASFILGAGTHTATVRATMSSGAVRTTQRTFTVAPSAQGGPAPESVAPGEGALLATAVRPDRPAPTRAALPARVRGRVGGLVEDSTTGRALAGSRVLLQARRGAGDPWSDVAAARVRRNGSFTLRWKPLARFAELKVALQPRAGFAASTAAVPRPPVSSCRVARRGQGWKVTCRTTARAGSPVRLFDGKRVADTARVRKGRLTLAGRGRVGGHRIEVSVRGDRVRLRL